MSDTPRVFIRSLSDYTSGSLDGVWIDVDSDLPDNVKTYLETRSTTSGTLHEEYAIHDYEGMPSGFGEYPDLDRLIECAAGIDEYGEAYSLYVDIVGAHYASLDNFQEMYRGCYDSERAWAEAALDDIGLFRDVPDLLARYFDFEAYARDAEYNGMRFVDGKDGVHVFDNL